jgi:hypothetical protein
LNSDLSGTHRSGDMIVKIQPSLFPHCINPTGIPFRIKPAREVLQNFGNAEK